MRKAIIVGLVLAAAVVLCALVLRRPTSGAIVAAVVRWGKWNRKVEPVEGTDLLAVSSPLTEDIAALPAANTPD